MIYTAQVFLAPMFALNHSGSGNEMVMINLLWVPCLYCGPLGLVAEIFWPLKDRRTDKKAERYLVTSTLVWHWSERSDTGLY